MGSKLFRLLGLFAIAFAVLGGQAGCSQERDPINRVQADALSKHFFVGPSLSDPTDDPEFYMGNRVIDEADGVGQGFFMFQSVGSLARIKWEIQETKLIARLTYERIQDSDYHGSQKTDNGQVVAEFAISSHFDIIRDYNPQTGEQLNVIVENSTDRPWYEREYFRVDWSTNLVTDAYDYDVFSLGAAIDGIKYDPLSYYVEDPSDPDAPVFSDADGYFDITTKLFATPQTVSTPYGTYPLCFFYYMNHTAGAPAVTCNPAEVKIRLSFKKVVDDDYEPEDWTGQKMDAFGWFTQDRYGYERNYGILDDKWHRFAAKYNIWQKSHVDGTQCAIDQWRDANGNVQLYKVDSGGNFVMDPKTGLPIPDAKGQPFTKSGVGLDVHRDVDADGTEDECQFTDSNGNTVSPGSRCDEFKNKCDIPLNMRTTKTTPFYYGPDSAPDLFASTAQALGEWNLAVKRATQIGKMVEDRRLQESSSYQQIAQLNQQIAQYYLAGDMASLSKANQLGGQVRGLQQQLASNDANNVLPSVSGNYLLSEADLIADAGQTVPDLFVLCHNPVIESDPHGTAAQPICGPTGLAVRLGDLRYNVVEIIPTPQQPSAWGIMTDFDDPVTGEKVQSSINEWEYVLDIASQNTEDIIRWINGEISNEQIANGQYMQQWLQASKLSTAQYSPKTLSTQEIQSRLNSIDKSIAKLNGLGTQKMVPTIAADLASRNLAQTLGPSLDSQIEATRQNLMGSQWEAQLLSPNMLQMAGFNPQQPFAGDPSTLDYASPLRGQNPRLTQWALQMRTQGELMKDMCVVEDQPEPDSLVGMARQAASLFPLPNPSDPSYPALKYQRDQGLHQWIREQFHLSVIAHEMGHSMGLRHNFTGSFDALNYHTEYWQLRTRNGAEHACPDATTPHTNGNDCVGPRWIDPVTDRTPNNPATDGWETQDLVWKWASSTVMDYPGDQTQDMNDIGPYDKAAMRFGYANVVDVEAKMNASQGIGGTQGNGLDFVNALDGFGGIFGLPIANNHYSLYNDLYHVLGSCSDRTDWNGDPKDPLGKECSGPNLDFMAERDMQAIDKISPAASQVRPDLVANFAVDALSRVRHPYMFGSDEFADFGNVPCFRFDSGADAYEQNQFLITTYENRYIFNDFRRNRVTFATGAVVDGLQSRYWDKVKYITKSLALGVELFTQPNMDPTTFPGLLMPMALGSADSLSMFIRAMTRPEPGAYVMNVSGGGVPNDWGHAWALGDEGMLTPPQTNVNVALGSGEGRFLHNDYDYTQGYWWIDYQKQVGSWYEKFYAPEYLTEAYNDFIANAKDDYIDGRYKNLSYMSLYPNQLRRIFANLMATQSSTSEIGGGGVAEIFTIAPYALPASGSGGGVNPLTTVNYLPFDKYDPNDATTTSLEYPKGAVLLDPLIGWEQQYPAIVNLFHYGPTSLSMDLVDQMRIFSLGDAESLAIPVNSQVRYRDPLTNIEYVAKNYGTEVVNSAIGFQTAKSMGARMIQHANYMAQNAYQTSGADPVTGELTYVTDGQGNPVPANNLIAGTSAVILKAYVANLDVVRQLTEFFGLNGPLGGNGTQGH
jgi:hypothetical protein